MSDKKLVSALFAAALGVATIATGSVSAAPFQSQQLSTPDTNVVQAQYRHREGMVRRGNNYYYNGHRGYRHYRPGYRRQGDFWFPPAAFALGAIIGGAIASQPTYQPRYYERRVVPRYESNSAHVRWCYDRYRSYRASDNTFQPYNGPRQQCYSPYS